MLSSVCWVSRAAARAIPEKFEISEAEAAAFLADSSAYIEENAQGLAQAREKASLSSAQKNGSCADSDSGSDQMIIVDGHAAGDTGDDIVKKYQLDEYPSESDNEADSDDHAMDKVFSHMSDLTMGNRAEADSYLMAEGEDLEEPEEQEDLRLLPSDFLIVAARAPEDDDIATIEYYVYEEAEDNLYVHHDIMLPSYPLCLEWMDWVSPAKPPGTEHGKLLGPRTIKACLNTGLSIGNLVAVGTFDPEIEIWNLDLLDPVYPELILGSTAERAKRLGTTAKASLAKSPNEQRHTDAVMCLSWNKAHRSLLASGSADKTVKLWDLARPETALRSYSTLHEDKVQSMQWNPFETSMLASASYDQRAAVFDTRSPGSALHYALEGDAEMLKWDPFHEHCLALSDENGTIHYVDIRMLSSSSSKDSKAGKKERAKALWSVHAHEKATTCVDFNPFIPSLLVSGSLDKRVKIWDFASPKPEIVVERDFGLGKLFSVNCSGDSPFLISLAGRRGELFVWNLSTWQLAKTDDNAPMNELRELMAKRLASPK